ncbi:MAG: translation elongation factor Ts [Cellulomonadaceae bacterium]|jgi:elongation factor Ts|nr:translation elongation factor Ts [Cellulomonadaceae bacterium]
MANYTVQDIKDLRALTGAGMSDVKKALEEADGNQQEAMKIIRERGLAKAAKREGNATSEGLVAVEVTDTAAGQAATLIEVNAETDFVVKNDKFIALAESILAAAHAAGATTVDEALAATIDGETVEAVITAASGTMGEKIVLRRLARVEGPAITTYMHRTAKDLPPSIGVVVVTDAKAEPVAKDIAQHIAAMAPKYLTREDVPADVLETEREIATKQTIAEGKPEKAIPKIVEGRLGGFFKENVVIEQPLAKDTKVTVKQHVESTGGQLVEFARFRVGN